MRDTAHQAGLVTKYVKIEDIGWDEENKEFVDADNETILNIFKLYPWEWMMGEEFGDKLLEDKNVNRIELIFFLINILLFS